MYLSAFSLVIKTLISGRKKNRTGANANAEPAPAAAAGGGNGPSDGGSEKGGEEE